MNKTIINVPPGIRYISEWENFKLPEQPCIIDKQITGCGFTEWCITGNFNAIIASPRLILLENKEDQHRGEVFYARNDLDVVLNVDRDLTKALSTVKKSEEEQEKLKIGVNTDIKKSELRQKIKKYFIQCLDEDVPCKILVTYDSYRIVYEALSELGNGCFESFYTVVDEFQSIFTDSRFKSDTELEFVNILQKLSRLYFVSATPMMDEYLDMLDEFKDLPYYGLDWGSLEPNRIISPQIEVHPCQKITDTAVKIIQSYLNGDFEKTIIKDDLGNLQEIESRELVVYVNSVKNICDIIRKAGLTYSNTNVLCSSSADNRLKIRKAFGLRRGQEGGIGKVPKKGDPHKMFTLCTRTVYLGADFYSTNARTVILSDANIDCLAVDITLDLPQILGRQRLLENPWKNRAELYARCLSDKNKRTSEEYKEYQEAKIVKTRNLLSAYDMIDSAEIRYDLAEKYQRGAKSENYKNDYIAVNTHSGKNLFPVFNKLAMVSELRAFQIQQVDYSDRFRVLNQILLEGYTVDPLVEEINNFMIDFNSVRYFTDKMKLLCETKLPKKALDVIFRQIHVDFSTYYQVLGPEKIRALSYQKSKLDLECTKLVNNSQVGTNNIRNEFINTFKVDDKHTLSNIKKMVGELYKKLGLNKTPKAVDILDYFEVLKTRAKDDSGKFVAAYKILKIKEDLNG